jgi:DNA-binding transcriptional regulator YdaS (Cro superfamily)
MDFKSFYLSMSVEQRSEFASRCETTVGQLRNIAYGRPCGEKLAISIDRESKGRVLCEELRPDVDFGYLRSNPKKAA